MRDLIGARDFQLQAQLGVGVYPFGTEAAGTRVWALTALAMS